jgi:hypothetical protein
LTRLDFQGIITPVNLENPGKPPTPKILSDDELRDVLEAAERRKDEDLRSKSRTVSIILLVPTLILAGCAAMFLILNQADTPPVPEKPAAATAPNPLPVAKSETDATLDTFRPEYLRANQPAQPGQTPKPEGKVIDKDDIRFAVELLNFTTSAKPTPPKH